MRIFTRIALIALLCLTAGSAWSGPDDGQDGKRTVWDAVMEYGDKAAARLMPRFQFAGVSWPPEEVTLLALKDTRLLEVWARDRGVWKHVRDYRIKGMSGGKGPKLREGDRQVPEGLYRISLLNPNSSYHLSMKLDYPNAFDRAQAQLEGRTDLGGDIFIHGKAVSRGCLAVGDNAMEELFVMTALLGEERVSVLISPRDYRFRPMEPLASDSPFWVKELNERIAFNIRRFPLHRK
ncbi:MAG: L,D-transpeptidase family protein [Candidatus Sedimenticola sp. PURPLELP]